jgi:hypothetical protein
LHQTEQACATNCQAILDAGTASLAALAAAKTLTKAHLDDLTAKLGAFKTLLTKPREAKAITKGATDQLPDKLDAGDRILERQIDRLMERYKTSNAHFNGAYQVARLIVYARGGHANDGVPPAPPQPAPPTK